MAIHVAALLEASPPAHAVGYPPGTLVVFHADFGFRWILHDGVVVDGGFGREGSRDLSTVGLAATSDGKVLEAFSGFRDVPEGTIAVSGIDVLSPKGGPEARLLFNNHHFDGIAVTEDDDVWVSDSLTGHLLQIDTVNGTIVREACLDNEIELLQDIDANGFFYFSATSGRDIVIRIRNAAGDRVRDVPFDVNGTVLPAVRVDHAGHLLAVKSRTLYALRPDGEVVDSVDVGAVPASFTLTPEVTGWFATPDFDPSAIAEIATNGATLRTVALPDLGLGYGTVGYLAFVPRAPRGSLCDDQSCPAVTSTPTLSPTNTPTSIPPEPTATPSDSGATASSGGCQAGSSHQRIWPWLPMVLGAVLCRRPRTLSRAARSSFLTMVFLLPDPPSPAVAADRFVDCSGTMTQFRNIPRTAVERSYAPRVAHVSKAAMQPLTGRPAPCYPRATRRIRR